MEIPRILVDPPWRARGRVQESAPPVGDAAPMRPPTLAWVEGERARFAGKAPPKMTELAEERLLERLLDECDKRTPLRTTDVARLGDESLATLADELDATTVDAPLLRLLLGRLGDDFAAAAVKLVRATPPERGLLDAALPLASDELVPFVAAAFLARATPASLDEPHSASPAEAWLRRHAARVVHVLKSAALQPTAPAHAAAHGALAFLAAHGAAIEDEPLQQELAPWSALVPLAERGDPRAQWLVLAAARMDPRVRSLLEGEACAAALRARIDTDRNDARLEAVPDAVAELPAFFDPAKLARPLLRDGAPLPDDAVRALGEMLRFSPLANPYVGLAQVREACDAASLDAFALDLFTAWREAGEEVRETWAFEACGKIGDERCARAVAERIRGWARGAEPPRYGWSSEARAMVLLGGGDRGFALARSGCAVLAALGGELAATHLGDLARGAVQAWLRREAASALGVPDAGPHDDVEAPVPDVGLDADGSATIAWGERSYRVLVDEALAPILVDANGERVASFPRARKGEDAAAHALAKERFAGIVKDAKIVARYQIGLLERMMCSGRTFRAKAFRERFLEHPFLRHVGRRVVWLANGTPFRIAEDGSFADGEDARWELGEADVGVVHPLVLSADALAAWKRIFADYQILQPFPQLARETHVLPPSAIGEHELGTIAGATTSRGRLFHLLRRDFRFDHVDVDPGTSALTTVLAGGASFTVVVSPEVGDQDPPDTTYTIVRARSTLALDRLPKIELSELVRDLEALRAK
jgi:hypothetical protein